MTDISFKTKKAVVWILVPFLLKQKQTKQGKEKKKSQQNIS